MKRVITGGLIVVAVYVGLSLYGTARVSAKCEEIGGVPVRSAKLTGGTMCVAPFKEKKGE